MKHVLGRLTAFLSTPLAALCFLSLSAAADEHDKLTGNWRLVSFYTEDVQTKERVNAYGEHPKGHVAITSDRVFAFVTADGRKAPQTPEEQAAAFRSMISYTGKYRLEGDKLITTVDLAWNESWVGTEQMRFWRLDGDKLSITTAPIPNPNKSGGMMVGTLVWERE
jgi:hypothetical protein